MDQVTTDIYRAVQRDDARGLDRARERVRRVAHNDLLARDLPGMLRVIDALAHTPASCDVRQRGAFRRGVCLLRRAQFDGALLAFARIPRRQGGAVYRDLAVRLMAEHRSSGAHPGSARP